MTRLQALMAALSTFEGRELVRVVDCFDAVELIFEADELGRNLVTIYDDGRVAHGFIASDVVAAGYGQ